MRSSFMFRDQVQKVTNWFKSWNECEQTVAVFSLLRKLNATQSKFLKQVLEQSLLDNTEIQSLEVQANNPAYISSLSDDSKENAVNQLLACLPLLQPGNNEAKMEYLKLLPCILNHSVENGCHIEESRQLLSYSLIHPAMTTTERSHLTVWLTHLEERYAYNICHQNQLESFQSPDMVCQQYVEKSDHLDNTNIMQSANSIHKPAATNWHQLGGRDTGIILNNNESVSPTPDMISLSSLAIQNQTANGRAITSTSALTPFVKTGAGLLHNVDVNLNSAGLTVDTHSTLQPTLSGPAAFTSVPSSHGLRVTHPSQYPCPQPVPGSESNNPAHRKLTRSISAITTSQAVNDANVSEWLNRHHDEMVQGSLLHASLAVTQSEPPHPPLSPQSSVSSSGSGSEGHHDDQQQQLRNTFLEEGSGMRDVPVWLKSLRLHKYSYLFQTMTYEQMLGLTEEWLKSQNVTKGARNKIILNVQKLQERSKTLQSMEKDVMESGNMKQALTELRTMMNTPLKSFSPHTLSQSNADDKAGPQGKGGEISMENKAGNDDPSRAAVNLIQYCDLPGEITRVLGKICTQLLVSTRPEDECFSMYLQMLDKCMMHEAFTMDQKRKLLSWRQQIQKIWHPTPQRFGLDRQRKGFGNTFPPPGSVLRSQRALRGPMIAKPGQPPKWTFSTHPAVTLSPIGTQIGAGIPLYRNNTFTANTTFAPIRPAMMDVKSPLARTHSAPIKSNALGFTIGSRPVSDMSVTEPEINSRLDSLCLSMTEHALGSFSDML